VSRQYGEKFKARAVAQLAGPEKKSAAGLSRELGVPQPTLSRWLREAGRVRRVSEEEKPQAPARRPEDWSPQEKLAAVEEYAGLSESERGAWLRRRGVKSEYLTQWREQALSGFVPQKRSASAHDSRRERALERELARKDKALAEAAALLVLRGKLQALWGAKDASTGQTSDESSLKLLRKRKKPERG
jgi:transposase